MCLPPLIKAPVFERQAQFLAAADVEFGEDVLQMGFDGFVGDTQRFGNFVIPVSHTGQCRDFLLAFRECIPTDFQFISFEILIPASAGKIHPDFIFCAALLLRGFLNGSQ